MRQLSGDRFKRSGCSTAGRCAQDWSIHFREATIIEEIGESTLNMMPYTNCLHGDGIDEHINVRVTGAR
jgi:hypothetical protein